MFIVSKKTLCFVFSFIVIGDPFSWLSCVDRYTFFVNFPFMFSSELSLIFCVIVTQGPYNVLLLFLSGHLFLVFPFESLMKHSHGLPHFFYLISQLVHSFFSFCEWNCSTLLVWLSHKVPVRFLHIFEVDSPRCCLV